MGKMILAISLVLVMVVVTTVVAILPFALCGCSHDEEDTSSVEEILDGVNGAMDDITSVRYDMDVELEMFISTGAENAGKIDVEMALSGVVDVENRQVQMDMDISFDYTDVLSSSMESNISMDMGMDLYLLDDTLYAMIGDLLTDVSWVKLIIPEETMQQVEEMLGGQVIPVGLQEMLTEVADATIEGSDSINGVACYRLKLMLDGDKIWQEIEQQAQEMGEEMPDEADREILDKIIQGVSIKQWVAKDTYFITRLKMDMNIDITPEDMGITDEEGAVAIVMTLDIIFYDYNKPVSIVLPPEAEEAEDMMEVLMSLMMDSGDMLPFFEEIIPDEEGGRVEGANTEAHDVEVAVLSAMVDNDVYELAARGTVGPGFESAVFAGDGVTELDVELYFYTFLEATYMLDEDGHIIAALATQGGRWDGLIYIENAGWEE